ncbi:MAG: AAA family ATPase [Granulosicoccus sp.]|nr:AAA family ATPase [Granulosicoccus sp.]
MKTVNYSPTGAPMQGYATVPATSDAKEYLRLLGRHKFGLLLTLLLGLGLAWLYLISTEKTYQTSALVEVKEQEGYLESDNGGQTDWNAPTIKEEANLLRSRKVLTPVVDRFNLRVSAEPKRIPVLGNVTQQIPVAAELISNFEFARRFAWGEAEIELAELQVPRAWEDSELILTKTDENAYRIDRDNNVLIDSAQVGEQVLLNIQDSDPLVISVATLEAPVGVQFSLVRYSLQSTINGLRNELTTETSDTKSRMITINLRGKEPAEIAALTNAILEEYKSVKLGSQNRVSDAELEFFESQLPKVESDLRDAEVALADFRRTANSFNQDTQIQFKLGQLDKLETQLLEKEVERDDLLKRYTVNHPTPKRLLKEIDVLNDKIRQVRGTIQAAPDTERELVKLEDDLDTKRTLFIEMSEKLQKLRLAAVGNVGEVQIIDDALSPRKPVSPNALLAIVGSTLATLFLYTLYLTLRSALSTVISDQESLERASGLPVYMNIPKSSAQKRLGNPVTVDPSKMLAGPSGSSASKAIASNVLALSKPEDYSIENLRGLRSMLEDVMAGSNNNVLMFTSPLPSMGKSFLSLNLAVLVAQTGKRVLLIDADYQRGQLHKSLGLHSGPGLPEVVRGKSELKETVKPTSVQNLYCIPRGYSGNGGAMEMPSDKEFGAFLDVVAPRFDLAIIDTPPVLSVSTAASLGKHAGSTIMVVKEGEVKEPQLNEALKRLTFSGVRISGCIMNGSSAPTPRHYTYYREQLD